MNGTSNTSLRFVKMHGLGNDFVIVDARRGRGRMTDALARAIGDRHRGVGCDQLAVIERSEHLEIAAALKFWNGDGGPAATCGNATRCVADMLMAERGVEALTLETERGALECWRVDEEQVCVNMLPPKLDWRQIPLRDASDTVRIDVKLGPIDAPVLWGPGAVNMGNPHAVFFVDSLATTDVKKLGPMLEHHPMFPQQANIGFAEVLGENEIRLRVWERGAGLTLACGSGACAAVVAGARRKLIGRRAMVRLDGGALEIDWRESDNCVLMTGPTQRVFEGVLDEIFLAAAHAS